MPLKIELQGQGAGSAVLQVSGDIDTPESVALAIQRNDGLYLGPSDPTHPDQVWQTSPHWRPQFGVQPRPGGLAMRLGADIVDGVIDAGGVPLKVSLRLDEQEESGVLRIRGELIGSGAAAPPPIPDTARDTDIPLEPEPGMPDVILEPEPQDRSDPTPAMIPEPPEHWKPQPAKKRRWWPWLLLLVLLGATAGAWYLGLFTPQPETADTGEQPNAVTPSSEQAAATTDEKPHSRHSRDNNSPATRMSKPRPRRPAVIRAMPTKTPPLLPNRPP